MPMLLPGGMTSAPAGRPVLNRNHSLMRAATEVWVPNSAKTLIRNDSTLVTVGTVTIAGRDRGMAASFATSGANRFLITNAAASLVFPSTTDCTVFIIRRSVDTTARASALFGYDLGTGARICMFAPFSDGTFYWDCGGTATNQRLTATSFAKSTQKEAIVCIAGGGKGREIWRNGVKIASDTSKTGTFAAAGGDVFVGGNTTDASDIEEVYMVGILARAWSDAEVIQWTRNPWQIFMPASQKSLTDLSAGSLGLGGSGATRPQVFVCT